MNYYIISKILGRVMLIEAGLMLPPMFIALFYGESPVPFAATAAISLILATLLTHVLKDSKKAVSAREGFVSVGLSWILMSAVGALPFFFSGAVPSYVDGFFETVSGFTTTGASILTDIEGTERGILFWRSLSQWIGGVGVLVFIMAVLPMSESGSMHIMRAEVPGPQVGKLVPKIRNSSAITYLIYVGLTALLIILLCLGDMPLFDSFIHAMSTASTGGYGTKALSIGYYDSAYIDVVISIFMMLFGVNFSIYYLMLIRKFKKAFTNSELLWYFGIAAFAVLTIAVNISHLYENFAESLRYSLFQVSSIMTTTGFATANFDLWPEYSRAMLLVVMFIGASSGSTGGGIKVSRFIILAKSVRYELTKLIYPRKVVYQRMDDLELDERNMSATQVFFFIYITVTFLSTLLVALDGHDFVTSFSAVLACISNVGPGLGLVGPAGSYAFFSDFTKVLLSMCMLIGRLEIYPILMLAMPTVWKRK